MEITNAQSDDSFEVVDALEITNRFEAIEPSITPSTTPEPIPAPLTDEDSIICCICSDPQHDLIKTDCGHSFHLTCLFDWNIRQSNRKDDTSCPVCRTLLHKHKPDAASSERRLISTGHRAGLSGFEQQIGQVLTHLMNTSSSSTQTSFLDAILNNSVEKMIEIINVQPNIVNTDLKDGMKPIHHCLYQRQFHLVDLLISKGANVKTRNTFGVSTLMIAVIVNSLNTCRKLINRGAEIEAVDNNGDTALFYAVRRQYTAIIKLLLAKGANVNHTNCMGMTIYQFLASNKDYSNNVLSILKRADPTCLSKCDNTGDSLLHTATESDNVRFLHKFKDLIDIRLRLQPNYLGDLPDDYIDSAAMEELYNTWQSIVNIVIDAVDVVPVNQVAET